jgi:hypothetical protein
MARKNIKKTRPIPPPLTPNPNGDGILIDAKYLKWLEQQPLPENEKAKGAICEAVCQLSIGDQADIVARLHTELPWLAKAGVNYRREIARRAESLKGGPAKGKVRVAKRRALVAKLKNEQGLSKQEIFDQYRDELTKLTRNARKPISFSVLEDDYKRAGKN